jgi:tRNA uridine 5-carboxymethylaminomethyl modification enzyme
MRAEGAFPAALTAAGIAVRADGRWRSALQLLGQDGVDPAALLQLFPFLADVPPRALAQIQADARYEGYLQRQNADIRNFRREETLPLDGLDYAAIGGLSAELRQKLSAQQPDSLGAASRIQGMTPAALATILASARKRVA